MVIEALKAARDFIENDRQVLAESLTVNGEIVFEDDTDRRAMAEYVNVLVVIDGALEQALSARVQEPDKQLGIYEHRCSQVTGHRGPSFVCQKAGHGVSQDSYCKNCTCPSASQPAPVQEAVACVQDLDEVRRKHLVYEKGMDWKDPLYTTPPAAQPAPVQQKPLFADIIAQHPGLAEELKAMDAAPVQELIGHILIKESGQGSWFPFVCEFGWTGDLLSKLGMGRHAVYAAAQPAPEKGQQ